MVATLGLEITVIKHLVKRPTDTSRILGSALGLRMIGCLALVLILAVSAVALGFTSFERVY